MRSSSPVRRGIRALALLAIAVYCVSSSVHAVLSAETAENGFVITETAITVVASDEQLSPDQKFVKQWEIQSSGASQKSAIDQLKLNVPGRVYVSYTEDESHVNAPSEALGIVRISGNSKDLINSIQVVNVWNASFSSSPELQVALDNTRITEASSLLTELVVMRKSALKALNTTGTADVVVLQDVLFSHTESSQESNTAAIQTSVMKDDTAQDGSGSWVIKLTSSDFHIP
uniref:Uncharacterized protein n=1 Tax=Globisporangium ultimum (strain ATCC 200006 / CBS 805.95 / DAOM BR144) TaxID=431595 RepID=K3W952_GLOUD